MRTCKIYQETTSVKPKEMEYIALSANTTMVFLVSHGVGTARIAATTELDGKRIMT